MKIFKVPETMSWSLSLSGEWTSWNWLGRVVRIKFNVFFSRVGKCTICSKPWSFIMSINICPSDWLNVEPDLLSLSGQSISLKLKSPRTWAEGSFLPLWWVLMLSSCSLNSWNSSLVLPGGRYQLATKWEVLFANTFTQIDSESFSSSVIGICEMSLWTSNMTPPPWIFLSFLYTLYGQVSGKSSEIATELSILVSWIATTCGW